MYEKIDGKIYSVATSRVEVDLDKLKVRKAELEALTRPPDEELIESGKYAYEFFVKDDLIAKLDKEITEIEKVK